MWRDLRNEEIKFTGEKKKPLSINVKGGTTVVQVARVGFSMHTAA